MSPSVRYDRAGDQHYDVASAFIKSIRGSDVDAALHYLARMLEAGEDPRFVARRIVISAAEDVGMADPDGAADRRRGGPGRAADRHAGRPDHPGRGRGAPGHRAEVQRRVHGNQPGDRRRPGRARERHSRPPARRPLPGLQAAGPRRRATNTPTTPRTPSPPSSTRRTTSWAATTTNPPANGAERDIATRLERLRKIIRGTVTGACGSDARDLRLVRSGPWRRNPPLTSGPRGLTWKYVQHGSADRPCGAGDSAAHPAGSRSGPRNGSRLRSIPGHPARASPPRPQVVSHEYQFRYSHGSQVLRCAGQETVPGQGRIRSCAQ